jgi:hypothetical protein
MSAPVKVIQIGKRLFLTTGQQAVDRRFAQHLDDMVMFQPG